MEYGLVLTALLVAGILFKYFIKMLNEKKKNDQLFRIYGTKQDLPKYQEVHEDRTPIKLSIDSQTEERIKKNIMSNFNGWFAIDIAEFLHNMRNEVMENAKKSAERIKYEYEHSS